jgi:YD repeat-containing protein
MDNECFTIMFMTRAYHTYLIATTDAYGYTSTTQYDNNYLLGVPLGITDINGATAQYTYDTFGRITQYLAPSDTNWTIKMYYYPSQTIPVAITERKEASSSEFQGINYFTSLFTDTWGEGIMSKNCLKRKSNLLFCQ